jgi:hypothetical protein
MSPVYLQFSTSTIIGYNSVGSSAAGGAPVIAITELSEALTGAGQEGIGLSSASPRHRRYRGRS